MYSIATGEFGRYQLIQYVLHLLPALNAGINTLSQVVVGATPQHRSVEYLSRKQLPN